MPPKPRYHKEDIMAAGLELLKESGIAGINARALATKLGCSTQPIFRIYQSMDALEQDLFKAVEARYNDSVFGNTQVAHSYEDIGLRYIEFARQEKNYFQYLFLNNSFRAKSFKELIADDDNQAFVQLLMRWTSLGKADAENYLIHTWIYMHGIATLLATNQLELSRDEIRSLLQQASQGFLTQANQAQGGAHEN